MMYKNLIQERLGVQYIFTAQNIPDQLFHTISHHVHLESVKEGQAQLWRPEERSSGVCSVLRAVLYSRMCAQLTLTPWGRPRHLASVLLYSEIESVPLRDSRTSPVLRMQIWVSPPQLSFSAQNSHHWDSCLNMRRRRGHFSSEVRMVWGSTLGLLERECLIKGFTVE